MFVLIIYPLRYRGQSKFANIYPREKLHCYTRKILYLSVLQSPRNTCTVTPCNVCWIAMTVQHVQQEQHFSRLPFYLKVLRNYCNRKSNNTRFFCVMLDIWKLALVSALLHQYMFEEKSGKILSKFWYSRTTWEKVRFGTMFHNCDDRFGGCYLPCISAYSWSTKPSTCHI